MCEATAVLGVAGLVFQRNASKQQKNALKRSNKPAPSAPTQASVGVRDAALRARRRAAAGGQSSTHRTNPLGITGDAPTIGNTLLGE